MKLSQKQKGLSSIGWLFVGVTLFFYGTIAAKVVPVYVNDLTVKEAMEKLAKAPDTSGYEITDVIDFLDTQFEVNNVRDINLRSEGVITINTESDKVIAEMNYEKIVPVIKNNKMLQNMDIVVRFKHTATLK